MSASCLRQSTHLTVERKNTVIKQRTSRTQCYQRPHCLYTLSLLLCKSLPSTEGREQKKSVLWRAKGGMLWLIQEVQGQETVPLQETRSHRHRHCSLGTSDFDLWVFSFTGKGLSYNWWQYSFGKKGDRVIIEHQISYLIKKVMGKKPWVCTQPLGSRPPAPCVPKASMITAKLYDVWSMKT